MAVITPKAREILTEINAAKIRIDSENEHLGELKKKLKQEMNVSGKIVNQVVARWYKGDVEELVAVADEVSSIVESLRNNNFTSSTTSG